MITSSRSSFSSIPSSFVAIVVSIAIVEVTWSLPPPPVPPGVVATCEQRSSCGPNNAFARLAFHARNCFCDDACRVFDDCCADHVPSRPLPGNAIAAQSATPSTFTCLRIEDIDTSFEYYLVDRCPRDYNANMTVRELCRNENLDDLFYRLPVAGRTSGLLYRNAYCALCSGEKDYVFWRVAHRCSFSHGGQSLPNPADSEATVRQLTQCVADLLPPEVADESAEGGKSVLYPRKCKSHVNKCDRRSKAGRKGGRCTGPTAYVYDGLQAYRNEECAQCNGVQSASCEDGRTPQVEDLDVDLSMVDISLGGPSGTPSGPAGQSPRRVAPPTTIIFVVDLNSATGLFHQNAPSSRDDNMADSVSSSQPIVIGLRQCDVAGQVFDPYTQICRAVKFRGLPASTTLSSPSTTASTTVPTTTITTTTRATTTPTTTSTTSTTTTTSAPTTTSATTTVVMTTITVAQETMTSSSGKVGRNKMKSTTPASFLFPVDSYDESDFREVPPRRVSQTTLRGAPRRFPALTTYPSTTSVDDPREDDFNTELTTTDVILSSTSVTIQHTNNVLTIAMPQSTSSTSQPPQVIVPKCDLLPVQGDFMMLENGSLSVMTQSSDRALVYSSHEYTRINDSLFVCVVNDVTSGFQQKFEQRETANGGPLALVTMFQLDRIQSLASLVGVLMSITGLVASLLVVICLPALRLNSHGRSLLCLVTCLLIGQSLYLLSTLHGYRVFSSFSMLATSSMCYWIAVATHYFLLAAFFWINVLAMDTTRSAFSGRDFDAATQMSASMKSAGPVGDQSPCYGCARFAAYSVYAWLVPAAVVAGSVVAEHLEVEEPLLRARYAAAGVCWPAGRQGITLLVGLPLAAITAANVVLYTLALAVAGCDVIENSVNEPRRRAVSGLLLTMLLALTWTSALVAGYLEVDAVWNVFVSLHACVGLLTCLAFVVNGQTLSLMQRNRTQYQLGCDTICRDAGVASKELGNGSGSVSNGHGSSAPWGNPRHPVPGPVPSYDEVVSHETSI